jgi:hypothetical protein
MVKRGGPWPLEPQPFRPLFDFRVVVVWDQAARLLSSAWSQNLMRLSQRVLGGVRCHDCKEGGGLNYVSIGNFGTGH